VLESLAQGHPSEQPMVDGIAGFDGFSFGPAKRWE
jgi:hypothetical protein